MRRGKTTMPFFSRLFGRRSPAGPTQGPRAEPEHYKGCDIHPDPISEGSQWRIAARIEKQVGGEVKSHRMIRADLLGDADTAVEESLRKARRLIDEQGDAIFERRR